MDASSIAILERIAALEASVAGSVTATTSSKPVLARIASIESRLAAAVSSNKDYRELIDSCELYDPGSGAQAAVVLISLPIVLVFISPQLRLSSSSSPTYLDPLDRLTRRRQLLAKLSSVMRRAGSCYRLRLPASQKFRNAMTRWRELPEGQATLSSLLAAPRRTGIG